MIWLMMTRRRIRERVTGSRASTMILGTGSVMVCFNFYSMSYDEHQDTYAVLDERWLDWLDSKIALLINREGVDPRVYGGKSYDE